MQKAKENTEKVNVTCRMAKDRVNMLDEIGEACDRDRSYIVNEAVEEYLARRRWQVEEVERARREVAEGNFLTEEEFLADVKTWL